MGNVQGIPFLQVVVAQYGARGQANLNVKFCAPLPKKMSPRTPVPAHLTAQFFWPGDNETYIGLDLGAVKLTEMPPECNQTTQSHCGFYRGGLIILNHLGPLPRMILVGAP